MDANQIVLNHLMAALKELSAQRDTIDASLRDLDALIARYRHGAGHESDEAPATQVPAETEPAGATMIDAILEYVQGAVEAGPVTIAEIVESLQPQGWTSASVRSQVARLAKDGALVRVARGQYVMPTDAETPVGAGASGNERSVSEGLSRKEGGPANGAEHPDGGDHPSSSSGDHYHGNRASMMEVR